jgi:protein tyrosine phosphatase (PTP) superfamily phosphohydrolase (DUF442 family)
LFRLTQVVATRKPIRRSVRWAFRGLVAAVVVAAAVTFRNPWFFGNFGVVERGRVYRSAQPGTDLPQLVSRHHLASIVNLRGGTEADAWYAAEVRATRAGGVDFYDLPMSATRRPLRGELIILLDLFDHCRYPVLIHCKSGSDRTGLAAALYRVYRLGESPEQSLKAFSLGYGHVPLLGPEQLHKPLSEYNAWLDAQGLNHEPARFRMWVEQVYESPDRRRRLPPLKPGPRRIGPRDQASTRR